MLTKASGTAVPKPAMGDEDPLPDCFKMQCTFDELIIRTQAKLVAVIQKAMRDLRTEHEAEVEALRSAGTAEPKPEDLRIRMDDVGDIGTRVSKVKKPVLIADVPSDTLGARPRKARVSEAPPETTSRPWRSILSATDVMPSKKGRPSGRPGARFSLTSVEETAVVPDQESSNLMRLADIWSTGRCSSKHQFTPPGETGKNHDVTQYEIDIFAHTSYRGNSNEGKRRSGWRQSVTNPSSAFNTFWRLGAIFLLTFDCLTIPMTVFDIPDDFLAMRVMMYVVFSFWNLDMPLSCVRGYINKEGELETRPKKVLWYYLGTHFLQDLVLLVIEWVNFIHVVAAQQESSSLRQTSVMRILKFMRLLKVAKASVLLSFIFRWLGSNLVLQMVSVPKVVVFIVMAQHLLACGWHWVAGEPGEFQERYATALHWSYTQMGFGWSDDAPTTFGERLYAIFSSGICIALLTMLIGAIVTEMSRMQSKLKKQRDDEDRMRLFMRTHRISWNLRNRIWTFLYKSLQKKQYITQRSVELILSLPAAITLELEAETWIPVLTTHPFFGTYAVSGVNSHAMRRLFEEHVVGEKPVVVEHELFMPWTPATHMYFIVSGTLYYRASRAGSRLSLNGGRSSARGSINLLFATNDGADRKSARVATAKENIAKKLTDRLKHRVLGGEGTEHLHMHSRKSDISSRVVEVIAGDWLCEPALWLRWHHLGIAAAKTDCELVSLEGEKFQAVMHAELPEAQIYARLYVRYAREQESLFDDVFCEYECLQEMAKQVFEPPLVFSARACHPMTAGVRSEWLPMDRKTWHVVWSTPFKEGHLCSISAMISTLTKDMKHDIVLLYQTMFAQNLPGAVSVQLSQEDAELHDLRVLFLKRLMLCLGVCRLRFTSENNGLTTQMWRYPLASAVCHGSRILVHLSDVPWKSFVNLLLFGCEGFWPWEDGRAPSPIYSRRAASHGIRMDPNSSQLIEAKLHGVHALSNNHLGMDLPLGGLGNPTPTNSHGQLYVGASGVPFRKGWRKADVEYRKEVQHGHLYMRWEEIGETNAVSLHPGQETTMAYSKTKSFTGSSGPRGGHVWCSNLECWLTPEAAGGEGWTEVKRVETKEGMRAILVDLYDDKIAARLHRLWVVEKELSIERDEEGDLRCRALLVQLAISCIEGGEDKFLLQRKASVQSDDKDSEAEVWNTNEVILPTLICKRNEAWRVTVARFLKQVMGLSDPGVRCLIGACCGSEEPYLYHRKSASSVCQHHAMAVPVDVDIVYDILHLTARLPSEGRHLVEPILGQGRLTKERMSIAGYSEKGSPRAEGAPSIEGTMSREWQWCARKAAEMQGVNLNRPGDSYPLKLRQEVENVNALLIGIESSAPMKQDLFGHTHSVDAVSKSTSAFGKRKWRDYREGGQEVPADLGGMHIHVSLSKFRQLREVLRSFPLCKPSDGINPFEQKEELELFQHLLQSTDLEAGDVLEDRIGINRDADISEAEVACDFMEC